MMFGRKSNRFARQDVNASIGNKPYINNELANNLNGLCPYGNNVRIYVDTCSLLHSYGMALLDAVENVMPLNHQQILIPSSVLYELENVGNKDSSKYQDCQEAIEKLVSMEANGSVKVVLTNSPRFSDAGFISRFVSELQTNDIVLLTQDRKLAEKVVQLKTFLEGCISSPHTIRAFYLTAYGSLAQYENEKEISYYEYPEIQRSEKRTYPRFFFNV